MFASVTLSVFLFYASYSHFRPCFFGLGSQSSFSMQLAWTMCLVLHSAFLLHASRQRRLLLDAKQREDRVM